MVGATVKEVGKQLNKVFTVDEIKKEIITKLGTLEKRIDSSVQSTTRTTEFFVVGKMSGILV